MLRGRLSDLLEEGAHHSGQRRFGSGSLEDLLHHGDDTMMHDQGARQADICRDKLY